MNQHMEFTNEIALDAKWGGYLATSSVLKYKCLLHVFADVFPIFADPPSNYVYQTYGFRWWKSYRRPIRRISPSRQHSEIYMSFICTCWSCCYIRRLAIARNGGSLWPPALCGRICRGCAPWSPHVMIGKGYPTLQCVCDTLFDKPCRWRARVRRPTCVGAKELRSRKSPGLKFHRTCRNV